MNESLLGQLEALLFIYGEAMSYKKIAQTLKIKESEVQDLVTTLETNLAAENRGLSLLVDQNKIQLTTKGQFQNITEEIIKEEVNEALTPAALEAAAIVTYAGPISRAELDYIRGVNSTFTLRNLLIRGLIERAPDPKRANAFVYSPSFEFLRHLGINKREALPEYSKFRELIKALREPTPQNLASGIAGQAAEPPAESQTEPQAVPQDL